jgi:hypothetical protein
MNRSFVPMRQRSMAFTETKRSLRRHFTLDGGWPKLVGAIALAGLILAGCGQADPEISRGAATTTAVPVTQLAITLPAASLGGLVPVVDQVGRSGAATTQANQPSSLDAAHRGLVATRGALQRYAVLLLELDDESLDELARLVGDLVESVDGLTAEVAAGRSDLAAFLADVEARAAALRQAWQAAAADWEAEWDRAAAEWHSEWDRAAAEWKAEWDAAGAEWDTHWERVAEDWEQAWEDAGAGEGPQSEDR